MVKKSTKSTKTKTKQALFHLFAPEAQKISLAGDFNGWNINDLPMKKDNEGNCGQSVLISDPVGMNIAFMPMEPGRMIRRRKRK
jgi:1,4-alpha-glucan branching enzyme